ncbi:MAG TPA: TIGR03885 family FMN-dependent LLM class oxidoreductase [Flavisolibacter sp.]|jgi:probable non-F420 flavinoid oxidoreductase|nr:TIGR03885 family FMN-dependent LLM class oxidoreductase [Flavisolibacter sp.]
MTIGYQASHEQFTPSELLDYVRLAEHHGFGAINSSDHFYPWSKRQGQSGFAFAWLGAAMQSTTVPFGSVCAPGQRYHPAIIAQAVATLGEMFPGRYWIALGSGEALNERITGEKWPAKADRQIRLKECAGIIRKLLNGETVTHHGSVVVEEAKLYTRPSVLPLLIGAAVTKETAAFVGEWADGMITVHQPHEQLKEVVDAFRKNGGQGKPVYLKTQLSFAQTEEEALNGAYDQWRTNIFSSTVLGDMWQVSQFDAMGEFVKAEDLYKMVRISSDVRQHIDWIKGDMELGFEKIILHNVNREQRFFIEEFGEKVLPLFANG